MVRLYKSNSQCFEKRIMQANEALYPIREVSNLTGVNSITLRAWERRYSLIEPVRTEGGHRLYTQAHIEQIKSAVALTEQGVAISQVKALLDEKANSKKIDFKAGESDFQNRLMEYALSYDSQHLNVELDNLFADLAEVYWLPILSSVTKTLKKESRSSFVFWESQLLPRLQTRLRFAMRSLNIQKTKSLWLECDPQTPQSMMILAALTLVSQGFYPYINVYSIYADKNFKELDVALEGVNCDALAFVSDSIDFDDTFWGKWADTHPGTELHLFLTSVNHIGLSSKVNCTVYNLKNFD